MKKNFLFWLVVLIMPLIFVALVSVLIFMDAPEQSAATTNTEISQ